MNGTRSRLARRGMAVLAALGAVAGSLAAAGPAASGTAAASGPVAASGTAGRVPAIAGAVSTVAGGVGGPGPATKVPSPLPCGVASGGGSLDVGYGSVDFPFFGEPGAVRSVNVKNDWLTTLAGTGVSGPLGDGGPAAQASVGGACGVAVDSAGNLVIADYLNDRVRVVAASTGRFYGQTMTARRIYTVAGDGTQGFSGDGGPAASAELNRPGGVAVDAAGNLLIADDLNSRVRVVAASTGRFYGQAMTAGDIYTVAGNGRAGFSGDGGPATHAKLNRPGGVAVDAAGNLVITVTGNERVRIVAVSTGTFYGQPMTAGDIYTVAGDGTRGFSGDGGPATSAELSRPADVVVDGAGDLLIDDPGNNRVRVVAAITGTLYGQPMTAGDIYTLIGGGTGGLGDGGPATSARLNLRNMGGVTVDGAGNLVVADTYHDRVRVVATSNGSFYGQSMTAGDIYTVAGDGLTGFSGNRALATRAVLSQPPGVAVDGAGDLVIADSGANQVQAVAASTGSFFGQSMTAGHIYTVAGDGEQGFAGDGGPATRAELSGPQDVTVDGAGNLVIADTSGQRVRVVAASTGSFYGQAMTAGYIYTVAGGGTSGLGDGGPATSAELAYPAGVAVDGAGNVVIDDTADNRVRVVAASTATFYGQPMTAGDIYTVAGTGKSGFTGDGGPATRARLFGPQGVVVDGAGNLVITDSGNQRVRVVAASTGRFYGKAMKAGHIYTVAGDGARGFAGNGVLATHAELNEPAGVVADAAGNLVIADVGNDRVRVVAASAGTFYGMAMKAGHIYTVAGDGTAGFSGDGGPATRAEFDFPSGVAVDAGNLVIADSGNNRIREVTG